MPTIDWLWLTAGLITGVTLGVALTLLLYAPLKWSREQREAVASANAQAAARKQAQPKPDLSDYPQITRNGNTLRVISNPAAPEEASARQA